MIWGTNLPITRTPDAHFMTEARYRGQKVVVVSPDYAEHVKFADHWLPAQPGTDGALAMAMGHVILKEFYVDRAGAVLPRLRAPVHRPAAAGDAARARRRVRARPLPARLRPRGHERGERRVEAGAARRAHRRARRARTARSGHRYGAGRRGPLEPRAGRDRAGADACSAAAASAVPVDLPRFDVGRDRGRHRDAPRRARPCGSAASS